MNEKLKKFLVRALTFIKRNFFTGLVFVLPLIVTYSILKFLFRVIYDNLPKNILFEFLPDYIQSVGILKHIDVFLSFLLTFISIIILGYFFSNYLGRQFFELLESLIDKLPFVPKIYGLLKQVIEQILASVQGKNKDGFFNRAVYVLFPHSGVYSMGFVTSENQNASLKFGKKMLNVFVPTTPNPTSGFLIIVPEEDTITADIKTEEVMKYIISLGIISDNTKQKK